VDPADLGGLSGRRVAVVGGGQSAVESAALLAEQGAQPILLARAGAINWLIRSGLLHRAKPLRRMLYAPSDIGPAGVSWLVALPDLFRKIPRRAQDPLAARAIRPAASAWLIDRVAGVPTHFGQPIRRVHGRSDGVGLTLAGGQ